jgi:hypothetical protein
VLGADAVGADARAAQGEMKALDGVGAGASDSHSAIWDRSTPGCVQDDQRYESKKDLVSLLDAWWSNW